MYRFTTPTIRCTLSGVDFSVVQFARIAIKGRRDLLIRQVTAADIDEGVVVIRLTQEETARLGFSDSESEVEIQARIKYIDGTVQPTNIVKTTLKDVLDKVVI